MINFDKNVIPYYGMLVSIFVITILNLNDIWLLVSGIIFIYIAMYFYYSNQKIYSAITNQYGTVKTQYSEPKPLTTMLDALMENGNKISDIKEITFISSDLEHTCKYLANSKSANFLFSKNKNLKINLIGYSENKNINCKNINININRTVKEINEHKNIIYMKNGNKFLWYEPHHSIKNKRHYFPQGAFFIEMKEGVYENIQEEHKRIEYAA
jgi:hypothetical protein